MLDEVSEQRLPAVTFEELALPLLDQLYNFAHWLAQDATEAEDLVQETYAKALRGFSSFQLGTNFRAWMFRILRNTFLTSRTGLKSAITDELDPDAMTSSDPTPETLLIQQSERDAVRHALMELPVPFREILLLSDVEEMSYEEIAAVLAIPTGTVMSRLHRARRALRTLLLDKQKGVPHVV